MILGFLFGVGISVLCVMFSVWRAAVKAYDEANR